MIRVLGVIGFTILAWLVGAYVEMDWEWFAHISRAEYRGDAAVAYLGGLLAFLTCPFLPWREQ